MDIPYIYIYTTINPVVTFLSVTGGFFFRRRTLDWPLNSRFHYGHPDLMDKLQVVQQGGVSKACLKCHEVVNHRIMKHG